MGETFDQVALRELQTLDPALQRDLASRFGSFMENIKLQMAAFANNKPKNYIVTEEDIREIMSSVRR